MPIESELQAFINQLKEQRAKESWTSPTTQAYTSLIPKKTGVDYMPHFAFADKLSDSFDERAAIIRGHMAQRMIWALKKKDGDFGWHAPGTDPVIQPFQLADGTSLVSHIAVRRTPSGVEYAPWVGWRVHKGDSDVPQIVYQSVLPAEQARRIFAQHVAPDSEVLKQFDDHFAPTPEARQRVYARIGNTLSHRIRPIIPPANKRQKPYTPIGDLEPLTDDHTAFGPSAKVPERFSRLFNALRLSRWTGNVHPLFNGDATDGPMKFDKYSQFSPEQVLQWARQHINPNIGMHHLAALAGWLPGTKTTVFGQDKDGYPTTSSALHKPATSLHFSTTDENDGYTRIAEVSHENPNEPPRFENSLMQIVGEEGNPFRGAAAPLYLRQMRAAHEVGIPRIHYSAVWSPRGSYQYTGGLKWPLIGGDGWIPDHYQIPPDIEEEANIASGGRFRQTRQMSAFFMSPRAKQYYLENPTSHDGFLETAPGSYSRKMIEQHVNQKAAERGLGSATPDEQHASQLVPVKLEQQEGCEHLKHPMIEHLLQTGQLHPQYSDEYFEN